jgi:hypothetical protein
MTMAEDASNILKLSREEWSKFIDQKLDNCEVSLTNFESREH